MKRVSALVLVVMSGCAASSATPARTAGVPAQLTAHAGWSGEVRVAKLRVWADDEYRAQNAQWERGFAQPLAYANRVLASLGVRLEAEYRAWDHRAPATTLV